MANLIHSLIRFIVFSNKKTNPISLIEPKTQPETDTGLVIKKTRRMDAVRVKVYTKSELDENGKPFIKSISLLSKLTTKRYQL
ncbi:hypothetical protein HN014_22200 (plasmid) [Aquimarina sp. TRL1]|uniref:hypothetical protein n=1 Tax=Aquimarina sp. (strain TRL1) TaxID=2736252 RepID=UPI00158B390B|nr:hypothetical protein [Aquimarina sp. TRL1]QKX07714.1 hypothetical protein HN014_22200 [Aquimarina sp. TRL1]